MSICGNPVFLQLIQRAVNQFFPRPRPFIIVVIGENNTAEVHSNMDKPQERVELMEQVTQHCKQMGTSIILPFKKH